MNITELKTHIEHNTLPDDGQVWVMEDDSSEFIAKQYINIIAELKGLTIKYINSFDEIASKGFIQDNNLYIYKIDKLQSFELHDNCIILCNKTDYKDVVKIPKLEKWQFSDYLQQKVPGMNKNDIDWLLTLYEYTYDRKTAVNYYRLDNDLDKIAIFPESVQNNIFNQLYKNGEYDTISNLTLFDLSNALLKRDAKLALQVLKVYDYIDSKPNMLLLSILLANFKKIVDIQLNPNATAESLGMSDKQYFVIKKYNCGYYSEKQLINIYEMLTNMEYNFKFGGISQENLADYVICKILGV